MGQPLLTKLMTTEAQWKEVSAAAMDLEREYAMRRTMLMTRLNATLQSFTWKDRRLSPEMLDVVSMRAFQGRAFTNVTAADVLAARRDHTVLTKVSSVPPSTRQDKGSASLTKVKIGQVPDRGGEALNLLKKIKAQCPIHLQDGPVNKKHPHLRCPAGHSGKASPTTNSREGVAIVEEEAEGTVEAKVEADIVGEAGVAATTREEVDISKGVTNKVATIKEVVEVATIKEAGVTTKVGVVIAEGEEGTETRGGFRELAGNVDEFRPSHHNSLSMRVAINFC